MRGGISLWPVWFCCPGCVLPYHPAHPYPYPSPLAWEQSEKQKTLGCCNKPYSAVTKTLAFYQHFLAHESKAEYHRGCYEENDLHPSQTRYGYPRHMEYWVVLVKRWAERQVRFLFSPISLHLLLETKP